MVEVVFLPHFRRQVMPGMVLFLELCVDEMELLEVQQWILRKDPQAECHILRSNNNMIMEVCTLLSVGAVILQCYGTTFSYPNYFVREDIEEKTVPLAKTS